MIKPTYKALESKVVELENILKYSELLKDNLPDIICVLDEDGKVVDINKAIAK
ncbi:MAG: hypothetical protein GY863_18845 [bacterium]|nr:hypothetical protein [bacterium]